MEECHKMLIAQVDWGESDAASYPDFGLELLVPEQMWIDDVCTYDVSAKYGISYWWFTRQKFYIDRHDSPSRRKDVRTHMRILSHLDHLSGSDKRMLSTAVKLYSGKHWDYTESGIQDQAGLKSGKQGLHVRHPEMTKDKTYLSESGKLCWWTDSRRRLPRTDKYGDSVGYTSDDLILILEILSRRFDSFKMNLPDLKVDPTESQRSSKDGYGDTLFQWSQFTTHAHT
ncbi:hypothetical protein Tco_0436576 [Tanacetum coccineum]